jgi:hypothetical protein
MRVEQGSGPLPNSAANSLPGLSGVPEAAAVRTRHIGAKYRIYHHILDGERAIFEAESDFLPGLREESQGAEEVDHRGVDLGGALLLGPVAAAR